MRLGGKPLLSASDGASLGEDELATSIQWLSIAETEFRLVQRDMTLVLGLPGEKSEDPPVERTTIIQGEDRPHSEKRKIISRLCHLIVSAETVSRALCWRPFGIHVLTPSGRRPTSLPWAARRITLALCTSLTPGRETPIHVFDWLSYMRKI